MRKWLAAIIISLTMVFVLGIASLAIATTITEDNQLRPLDTDVVSSPSDPATDTDNGINNVNQTGKNVNTNDGTSVNDVIKATNDPTGKQRTHGEYQNNTNSCASCHSPHGSYSDRLLHYNPNGIATLPMRDDDAGTYTGISKAANGGVNALTGGTMLRDTVLAAAPAVPVIGDPGIVTQADLDAAILASPDFVAVEMLASEVPYYDEATDMITNGISATYATGTDHVVVVLKKITQGDPVQINYVKDSQPWINGGQYNNSLTFKVNYTGFYDGDPLSKDSTINSQLRLDEKLKGQETAFDGITMNYQQGFAKINTPDSAVNTLDKEGNQVLTNTVPFVLKGVTYAAGRYSFLDASGIALEAEACLDDSESVVSTENAQTITTLVGRNADLSRAIVLELAMDPSVFWFGDPIYGVKITKVDPASYETNGLAISTFCAACHTDYLVKSGSPTGVWSKRFGHTTNNNSLTCLKCHFAHGSDVTTILDSEDRDITRVAEELFGGPSPQATIDATAYLLDQNPSSALKRYTNTSVCRTCHEDYTY
ncbi:hypothetical protein [Desulfosporosinus sp. BICA1-9]|uniref:hypothetical protein n=1 Tax=Desulfosporosinus sp. BICA1-9 TaxID=1531958 RepID=UPI00054B7DEA|nr:hypothetical protein [Desulfosporosinus sp. BICA1-9]KJS47099.1 MAG: hypothetical protein VR66_21580 [Peptococcaceae bacterium BRH_c23]KJS80530.1 MAG: hypothetical protein JL57_27925 [Desulfosporosinus sp. BICA1-9]HBW35947.1 hypothetical protein [Desulfosporosinus sp.]